MKSTSDGQTGDGFGLAAAGLFCLDVSFGDMYQTNYEITNVS